MSKLGKFTTCYQMTRLARTLYSKYSIRVFLHKTLYIATKSC